MNNIVIGFAHGEGFCIRCGKHFAYNDLHPESMCHNCKSLPKGQQLGERKYYCHHYDRI